MDSNGAHDLRKVRKILLIALLVYVVFNHTVRIVASRPTAVAPTWMNWTSSIGTSIVQSLDLFRRRSGGALQRTERFCPELMNNVCDTGLRGLRDVLGL